MKRMILAGAPWAEGLHWHDSRLEAGRGGGGDEL